MKKHLYMIDIYRIFAVFIVFVFHLNIHFNFQIHIKIIDRFINQGATVMTLFFMLSGFLLYYLHGETNLMIWENFKYFCKKRILKIYPLYISFIATFYILFYTKENFNPIIIFMQIIPLQGFFQKTFSIATNGGTWFISVIFFAYLCFPFLAFILKSIKFNSFILFFLSYILCNYFVITDLYYTDNLLHLYISPIFRLLEFFIGMITAKIFIETKQKINLNSKFYNFILTLCIFGYLLFVGGLSHSKYLNNVYFCNSYLNYDIGIIILFTLILYFSAIIENSFFYKIAKNKVTQYLSKISYSFYLTQCIVLGYFLKHKNILSNNYKIFFITIICNLILASFMYEFIQNNRLYLFIKSLHTKFIRN